jgi:hypothetical protein
MHDLFGRPLVDLDEWNTAAKTWKAQSGVSDRHQVVRVVTSE